MYWIMIVDLILQILYEIGELLASETGLFFLREKITWNPTKASRNTQEPWRALYGWILCSRAFDKPFEAFNWQNFPVMCFLTYEWVLLRWCQGQCLFATVHCSDLLLFCVGLQIIIQAKFHLRCLLHIFLTKWCMSWLRFLLKILFDSIW